MEQSQEEAFKKILKERRKNSNAQGGEEEKNRQRLSSSEKILSFDPRIASGDKFAYRLTKQEGKVTMPGFLAEQFQSTLTEILPENLPQESKHYSLTVQACFFGILDSCVKSLEKDLLKACYRWYLAENLFPLFLSGSVAEVFSECYILARVENGKAFNLKVMDSFLSDSIELSIKDYYFSFLESKDMKSQISHYITEKMIEKSVNHRMNEVLKYSINMIYFKELAYKSLLGNFVHKIAKLCKNENELGLITFNKNPLNEKVFNGFLGRSAQKVIYSQYEAYQAINEVVNNTTKKIIWEVCREILTEQNKRELKDLLGNYFNSYTRGFVKCISMTCINRMKISTVIARLMERKVLSKTIADIRSAAIYSDKISHSLFSDRMMYSFICKQTMNTHKECSAIDSILTDLINSRIKMQINHYLAICQFIEEYVDLECVELCKYAYKKEIICAIARDHTNMLIANVASPIINKECELATQITSSIACNTLEEYYKKFIVESYKEIRICNAISIDISGLVNMQFLNNYCCNIRIIPEIYTTICRRINTETNLTCLCIVQCEKSITEETFRNFFSSQLENFKLEEDILCNLFIKCDIVGLCDDCFKEKTNESVITKNIKETMLSRVIRESITNSLYNVMTCLHIEDDLIKTSSNALIERVYLTQLAISKDICNIQCSILEITQTSTALAMASDELIKETCCKSLLPDIFQKILEEASSLNQVYCEIGENLINKTINETIGLINCTSYKLALAKEEYFEQTVCNLCINVINDEFPLYIAITKDLMYSVANKMTTDYILAYMLLSGYTNEQIKSTCKFSLETSLVAKSCSESIISKTAVAGLIASSFDLASLAFESTTSLCNPFVGKYTNQISENMILKNNIKHDLVQSIISQICKSTICKKISMDAILSHKISNNYIGIFTTNIICNNSQKINEFAHFFAEESIKKTISKTCTDAYNSRIIALNISNDLITIENAISKIITNGIYKYKIVSDIASDLINQVTLSVVNDKSTDLSFSQLIFMDYLEDLITIFCQKQHIEMIQFNTNYLEGLINSMSEEITKKTYYSSLFALEETSKIERSIAVQETYTVTVNTFYKKKALWLLIGKFLKNTTFNMLSSIFYDIISCEEIADEFIANEINNNSLISLHNKTSAVECYDTFISLVEKENVLSSYILSTIIKEIYEEIINSITTAGVAVYYEKIYTINRIIVDQNAEVINLNTTMAMIENIEIDYILCQEVLIDFIRDQLKSYCLIWIDMELTVVFTSDDFICSAISEICRTTDELALHSLDLFSINIEKSVTEQMIRDICMSTYTKLKSVTEATDEMIGIECEKNIQNCLNNCICSSEIFNKCLSKSIINEQLVNWIKEYEYKAEICNRTCDSIESKLLMTASTDIQMNQLTALNVDICLLDRVIESQVKNYAKNTIAAYQISSKVSENYFDNITLSFKTGTFISQTASTFILSNMLNDLIQGEINNILVPVKIYETIINRSIGELNTSPSKKAVGGFVGKISQNAHSTARITEVEYTKMLDLIVLECMCKPCLKRAYLYKKNANSMAQDIYSNLIQVKMRKILLYDIMRSEILLKIEKEVISAITKASTSAIHQSATIRRAVSLNIENTIFDEILYPKLYDCVNYASETKLLVEFVSAPYLWNTQNMMTENLAINYSIAPEIINDYCSQEIFEICKDLYVKLRFSNVVAISIIEEFCKRKTRRAIQTIFVQEHYAEKSRQILLRKFEVQTEGIIKKNCENSVWEYKISSQFSEKIQCSAIRTMLTNKILKDNIACLYVRETLIENAKKAYCQERIERTIRNKEVAVEIYGKFIERMTRTTARFSVEEKKNAYILAKNIRDKYYLKWITEQSKVIRESQFKNSIVTNAVFSYLVRENIRWVLNEEKQNKRRNEIDRVIAQEILNKMLMNAALGMVSKATLTIAKIREITYSKLLNDSLHDIIGELSLDLVASELIAKDLIENQSKDFIVEAQAFNEITDKCITNMTHKWTKDMIRNQTILLKVACQVANSLILNANLAFCCKIANKQKEECKTVVNVKNKIVNDLLKSMVIKQSFGVLLKMLVSNSISKNLIESQKKKCFNKIKTGCYLKATVGFPLVVKMIGKCMRNICSDSIDEVSENEMLMLEADDHPATTTEIRKKPMMPSKVLKKPAPSPSLPQKKTPAPTIKIVKSPARRISQPKPDIAKSLGNTLKTADLEKQNPAKQIESHPKVSIKKPAKEEKEEIKETVESINQALFKLSNNIERKAKTMKLELKPTITTHKVDQILKQVNTILLNGLKNNWVN